MSNFSKCAHCGKQILWIKTKAGKNMPCDAYLVDYKLPAEGEKGKERIVTQTGDVVAANVSNARNADGTGYISHFATCPNYGRKRR